MLRSELVLLQGAALVAELVEQLLEHLNDAAGLEFVRVRLRSRDAKACRLNDLFIRREEGVDGPLDVLGNALHLRHLKRNMWFAHVTNYHPLFRLCTCVLELDLVFAHEN